MEKGKKKIEKEEKMKGKKNKGTWKKNMCRGTGEEKN